MEGSGTGLRGAEAWLKNLPGRIQESHEKTTNKMVSVPDNF
jgi:hypothetical protein